MTDLATTQARYPTVDELHAQILSDTFYGFKTAGLTVNAKKKSALWHRTRAIANQIALAVANCQIVARTINPLRAVGDDLIDLCRGFGVFARPASFAGGRATIVVADMAGTVSLLAGRVATSPQGIAFELVDPWPSAGDGQSVEFRALEAGPDGNQDPGTSLGWDDASTGYLGKFVTIDANGFDGGAPADTEEDLRRRLLRKLAFPAVGGNWSYVANIAEESSAAVRAVYVFETARGASTYDVAIQGSDDDPVLTSTVQAVVRAAILAAMPGSANLLVTSIAEDGVDVIVDLDLPLPDTVGGAGGGWTDARPWPSDAEAANEWAEIDVVGNDSSIDGRFVHVLSTSADPPQVGNRFGIWIPSDKEMVSLTAAAIYGTSGDYTIVVDAASAGALARVVPGMYCSPWAEHLETYADLIATAFGGLGVGEKTQNVDLLTTSRRQPPVTAERPSRLTTRVLANVIARTEVAEAVFAARWTTGTKITQFEPAVPSITTLPPRKLALRNLAFRRQR